MIDPANDMLKRAVAKIMERDLDLIPDPTLLVSVDELIAQRNLLDVAIAKGVQRLDSRDVTVTECAATTRSWLIDQLHLGTSEANRYCSVGRMLPAHIGLADALEAGLMNLEHARAISICLRKIDPALRDVVEKELVRAAEDVDPASLAAFTREICDRLGGNERAEAAAQRKHDNRWLRMTPTYDGMHRIDGMLDPESAAVVKAALNPLIRKCGAEDLRCLGQRMADGLVTMAELSIGSGALPEIGGERAQVIATLPASDLLAAVKDVIGKTGLLNGEPVTITTIRQWACDAQIIPAVLGANGEVLDLGRKTPMWSAAQRRALRIEDGGCGWPGCKAPLSVCRIHHLDWWSRGGLTSVRNGVHLCPFHHYVVHHTNWKIKRDNDRQVVVWRT